MKVYNLNDIKERFAGKDYENTYGQYLDFFRFIASEPVETKISIHNCPRSWAPFLHCLGCSVESLVNYFPIDNYLEVDKFVLAKSKFPKEVYDVFMQYRPETVDAIWKVYMQDDWMRHRILDVKENSEFTITTDITFYRRDIMYYIRFVLLKTQPTKRNVLLVPCAADKPYPAPMHQKVLDVMPNDYYLATVTGALGLVPQELWDRMPNYDAGIPNEMRLFNVVYSYFLKYPHNNIVCYLDNHSKVLYNVFSLLGCLNRVTFINPVKTYTSYMDLQSEENIKNLSNYFEGRDRIL
jgi:hypothetical protein